MLPPYLSCPYALLTPKCSSLAPVSHENFDEYTRRQYLAKAPARNPFGEEEEPRKFQEMSPTTKIRVLFQLAMWTSWNPDRFRALLPEQTDRDQTQAWRVEEFG
ncbi:hypothetical protein KEM52_002581, partial [Ascosphaera acerosa]